MRMVRGIRTTEIMVKKGNKWKSTTMVGTMFAVMMLLSVMPAMGEEGSSSEPHFDRWVEQRDMSNFGRYIPPIEKKVVPNEMSEILYPGFIVKGLVWKWSSRRHTKIKECRRPYL